MSLVTPDLQLFHGGRLTGPVELRTRSKSMAYGPGFYMTTSYWTARDYRGGSGFVYRITVDGDLRWAHRVRLDGPQLDVFLGSIPRLKRRREVNNDLFRLRARRPDDTVSMTAVLNMLDIHQSYGASVARDVARAIVAAGVDASLVTSANGGNEDWVVLHNVQKVRKVERLTGPEEDAPRLKDLEP